MYVLKLISQHFSVQMVYRCFSTHIFRLLCARIPNGTRCLYFVCCFPSSDIYREMEKKIHLLFPHDLLYVRISTFFFSSFLYARVGLHSIQFEPDINFNRLTLDNIALSASISTYSRRRTTCLVCC